MSVFFGTYTLQNFQLESPKMKLCEFVRVPMVSDCAKFAVQISKDEAPTPLLTVKLFFIFEHLSRVHLATVKIHSVSQTPPNLKQVSCICFRASTVCPSRNCKNSQCLSNSTKLQTKDIAGSSKQ